MLLHHLDSEQLSIEFKYLNDRYISYMQSTPAEQWNSEWFNRLKKKIAAVAKEIKLRSRKAA